MDLVLSSGFLAFARHAGVLAAVEARGLAVDAVVGTSSGALVGALWAAGHRPDAIMAELGAGRPFDRLRVSWTPWRGAFRLDGVIAQLRGLLPARFEALPRPLGVAVALPGGGHRLLTAGSLVEAVVASCAMPYVFEAVEVDGLRCFDGGAVDRLGVEAWRAWRGPGRRAIAHHVERTRGVEVEADLSGVTVVRTPRSGASLWDLGDWRAQMEEARTIALAALP